MYPILLCITLGIFTYIYLKWNMDYWKKRKVHFEKPVFFLGNFKDVLTGHTHIWMKYVDLYRKFQDAPYIGYYKLHQPAIIIRDPDLVRDVLIKDFDSFADNDFLVNEKIDHIWAANAFIQTGEEWSKTRKIWTHTTTTSRIKGLFDTVLKKSDIMVERIKEHFRDNPDVPLEPREMSAKFFTDSVVDGIFGVKNLDTFKNPKNKYFNISTSIFESSYYACLVTFTFMVIPWVGKLLRFRFVTQEMEDNLMSVARDVLEIRKNNGFNKNNSLDVVLINKIRKEGEAITDLEMARALFGFLLDATETSSGIAGFLLHTLATYPDVQEKVRQEIKKTYEEHENLTYDVVRHNMPYLEMVLCETLRHHPPLLGLQRICTKPYTLRPPCPGADPVKVPKGMSVIVPVYALHMDPKYYPEPEKFIPERYSEENKEHHRKYTYMPFGEGPRICLGTKMAVNNLKIMTIALVKNFDIKLAPHMVGKPIVTDPYVLPKRNLGDLWVTFHERNSD